MIKPKPELSSTTNKIFPYQSQSPLPVMGYFFNCYLAALQLILCHFQGDSLLTLVNHFIWILILTQRSPGAL